MSEYLSISKGYVFLLFVIISTLSIQSLRSEIEDNFDDNKFNDLKKLRHFLLTSNANQRAAKREQQMLLKRKLIEEYFESLNDSNPNRIELVKRRFCASWEEFQANRAACLG